MKYVFLTIALLMTATPGMAQQTLDERIAAAKADRDAKAAKAEAEARAREQAAKLAATPATAMPTVTINASPARVGGFVAQPQAQSAPAPVVQPDRVELIRIKGFQDEKQGLEAMVTINGVRYAATLAQPRITDLWELASITPDGIELMRPNQPATKRSIRFASAAILPPLIAPVTQPLATSQTTTNLPAAAANRP